MGVENFKQCDKIGCESNATEQRNNYWLCPHHAKELDDLLMVGWDAGYTGPWPPPDPSCIDPTD